jgi:phosphatidylserine/phosphatidylglycerophosphate/cardiolipin synthase-like enzyme
VFSVALSLALSALPAASVTSSAAIAVCFSPEEDCAAFAVRAIDNAEREILACAYGLTTGSGIVEALVRAKERGVDVRLIADKTTPCERASGIEPLAAARVPIWIDIQGRIAHAKTMVIDGAITLTGSMNWTLGAATNSEALNLVSSPTVAAAYAVHWRERLAVSVRYERAEEHFQSMVKAALMALFDDPQIQQRVVLLLRNRIRSEPSLLR